MFRHSFTPEFAIIALAVCNELLATLVAREIISPNDVRDILERSIHEIKVAPTEAAKRAITLIESELIPKFSESGS
jgi:hypothetical protein